jgi:hypothetical protein
MKVYREDKLVWEGELSIRDGKPFPLFIIGEILTIIKKDGTVVEGAVQSRAWSNSEDFAAVILVLPGGTAEKVMINPGEIDTLTITYPEVKLEFTVESKTVPHNEGSFYVAEFHIDQNDRKNIVISSVRKPGKPSREELGRFSLMSGKYTELIKSNPASGKYRELGFYGKWDDVPLMQNALASYLYGRIYNPASGFKIISVQVWGYDADLGEFIEYKLPTLEDMNIVPGGITLEQAYATLFKDFNVDHWR